MPVEIDGIDMYSMREIANEIGVSRQTLWRWRHDAKIPAGHRFRDGRVLFIPGEVEEIRSFANRLEPIDQSDKHQLRLFG